MSALDDKIAAMKDLEEAINDLIPNLSAVSDGYLSGLHEMAFAFNQDLQAEWTRRKMRAETAQL